MQTLTPEIAAQFAATALGHVEREYPNKLDHVLTGDADAQGPRTLHPVFFGSFDWHSCVHGYWLLARLLRTVPNLPQAAAIRALFARRLTPEAVAGELAYLSRPSSIGFERPYGWAWLLMLSAELARHDDPSPAAALQPLASAFDGRFRTYLPKLTYPIRAGTHANTAFSVVLALEYADLHDPALASLLRRRAEDWFAADQDCPAWEPGGDDFLSSCLIEALCMARVLSSSAFASWFGQFLPRVQTGQPAALFIPATVSDRGDGKIAHLDGTNFTRAWCLRSLPPHPVLTAAAEAHIAASLPHIASDYMGEHWLATFALLALTATPEPARGP